MCGFAAVWEPGHESRVDLQDRVLQMVDVLKHRGPDDSGTWAEPEPGIALGFRRLAILDLSPEGHQPMFSQSGRYVIAYNGEVYNFASLRHELQQRGHGFRGHSDTESILAAIEEWGVEAAVSRFRGMFAFALWDRHERTLSLARDRLGIKPLYYGWTGHTFLCASELKALRAYPGFAAAIGRGAVSLFVRHGYIPQPLSIYENVSKLPAGTILTLGSQHDRPAPIAYWSAREVAERGAAEPFSGSDEEALEQLDSLLREAVRLRMVADVPLGAFLSGGIDSSTVVALMQAQSERRVSTFSIGFHEPGYNEAVHAAAVARHLGTDHTELYITASEALAVIPQLPDIYDEPFSDSSQIPTYLISKLTRDHVTVSLSGDGGDELFCGYSRYFEGDSEWRLRSRIPTQARKSLGWALRRVSQSFVRQGVSHPMRQVGRRVGRFGERLALERPELLYRAYLSHSNPSDLLVDAEEPVWTLSDPNEWPGLPHFLQRMMYLDTVTFLPDDILLKVDRASMAVSLEARVPLLDHKVVEFAFALPIHMKHRSRQSKWLLRQLLYRYVPQQLIERPKMGFGVPIATWMCGPLRDWAEDLLSEGRLRQQGFLNPSIVRSRWAEHLSGHFDWGYWLWNILMFQAWADRWDYRQTTFSHGLTSFPEPTGALS